MAGGFAVIKDVPKNLVYRVSRHFNERKDREVIPDSILTKEPTAELREDQRDKIVVQGMGGRGPISTLHAERLLVEGGSSYLFSKITGPIRPEGRRGASAV